jgi:hypothetical protein
MPGHTTTSLLACALAVLCGAPALAHADDVRGEIQFKPDKLGAPPERNQGFVERIENPLRPVQSLDPRPYMVVVLEGGPVDDEAKKPPGAIQSYELRGESFEKPLFPVITGTRVKLVNRSARVRVLLTPNEPELVDSVSLNPRGEHEFKVEKAHQTIVVNAEDTNHLHGRVLGLADRYFALLDARGRFEISKVPEGTWKLRVWYRDGWLAGVEESVEVSKKRTDVSLTITPDKVRGTKP